MLYLAQGIVGILHGVEDAMRYLLAVAVNRPPTTVLFHLGIDVVVVGPEEIGGLVFGFHTPATQIVHIAPHAGVLVAGGIAPCVVVQAVDPLLTGQVCIMLFHEHIGYHHHPFAVDATPTVALFDTGIGHRLVACVGGGVLIDRHELPVAIVVDKAPFVVGRVHHRIDPFAGFVAFLPCFAGGLSLLPGVEDVADNHLSTHVAATPIAVQFHHGKAFELALKLESGAKLWGNLPAALVVAIAVQLATFVLRQCLCRCPAHKGEKQDYEYSETFHITIILLYCENAKLHLFLK